MEEINVFTGKTVEEAVETGLTALGLTADQAEITVLEEGKKKLFGSVKAKVQINKKLLDGERATQFIDGLLKVLGVSAVSELESDGEKIEINITSTDSNKVIGRHGEVLDAIQCLAGAVANIGRDEYKKVVVDCENYRASREKTLTDLANRLAAKAVEKQKRVTLEPMNPYERRIIHSALAENDQVKTVSSGKEPVRFIVIIPNNEKPFEAKRNGRFNGKGERREGGKNFRGDRKPRERRNGERREEGERGAAPRSGGRNARKKEIHFGTFLGNSNAGGNGGSEDNGGSEE